MTKHDNFDLFGLGERLSHLERAIAETERMLKDFVADRDALLNEASKHMERHQSVVITDADGGKWQLVKKRPRPRRRTLDKELIADEIERLPYAIRAQVREVYQGGIAFLEEQVGKAEAKRYIKQMPPEPDRVDFLKLTDDEPENEDKF